MGIVFKNNAKTTLASNLTSSATSASVTDGSVFPSLSAGEFFLITFDDGTNNEICKCTARSGNTLTIVRAQESTTARSFSSGDAAEGRVTAGVLETIQENIAAKSANQTVYNTTTASSATDYDIGIDPGVEANAMVFLNGVMQHHDTFSFSSNTLTFDTAPPNGMALEVIVDNLINLQSSNLTVDTFTATSGQTDFVLSDTPAAETNLIVFVDGVFQDQDSYTISNNTLTITDGVVLNRGVTVYVINPVNIGTPSDGTVTSAKLSGNITMPGTLTVGSNDVAFDSPTFVVDNANSRVGLGTASPSVPVDIVGDVKMSANLTVDTSTLVVDSTNNRVGVGTASPGQAFHVNGSSATFIQVGNNNGSVLYGVNTAGNAFVSGQTSSKDLIFEVNNGNNMRLHNSGKFGVGTGNVTPTGKVTIAYPSGNNAPNTITAANTYLQLGSEDYGPNNDGKFMIGFGYTDGTTNTHSPAYIGYQEVSTSGDTYGKLGFYTRNVTTDTAPTQRMSIAEDGKIDMYPSGAETTGGLRVEYGGANNYEVARFQSNGDYDAHVSFRTNGTNDYYWGAGIDYSDSGKFKISQDNLLATNTRVTITTDGKVGIGRTDPTQLLEVHKSTGGDQTVAKFSAHNYGDTGKTFIEIGTEYGDGSSRIGSFNDTGNSSVLVFDTHSTTSGAFDERMRIESDGAVGIGTGASPGANRLSVRNPTYNSGNRMLIVSNGNEDTGAAYDTVVINQADVPTLRLIETLTDVQMTMSCGNENSNSAVLGTTGKLVFTTNNSADYSGYSVANKRFEITDNDSYFYNAVNIRSTGDQILTLNQNDTGGWNYIGYQSQGTRKWYLGMDNASDFRVGSDVAGATFDVNNANLKAPGVIVQTVRGTASSVTGTGDFDVVSVNITPKFSDSDMIIHFFTQWSVHTNDGEDWGLQLQRDGTAIVGDGQNGYFINGGGVDATDYASQYGSIARYHVRQVSKTDIDTGRSSGTSQITYKIRKVVPANTSTKQVRFGIDGWTGTGVESQRSLIVLIVQEILPN